MALASFLADFRQRFAPNLRQRGAFLLLTCEAARDAVQFAAVRGVAVLGIECYLVAETYMQPVNRCMTDFDQFVSSNWATTVENTLAAAVEFLRTLDCDPRTYLLEGGTVEPAEFLVQLAFGTRDAVFSP
jgi:hypothetical protein